MVAGIARCPIFPVDKRIPADNQDGGDFDLRARQRDPGGRLSVLLPRIGYRETNRVFLKEFAHD